MSKCAYHKTTNASAAVAGGMGKVKTSPPFETHDNEVSTGDRYERQAHDD